MKTTILPLIAVLVGLAFLPCCYSCSTVNPDSESDEKEASEKPDKQEQKEDQQKPEKLKAGDYTVVFPDQTGFEKTGWEEGDAIYIHGNYGPNATVCVLKAEDIEADGKSAKVHLDDKVMEFQFGADGLYAVYPADAVLQGDSLMDSDATFTSWDQLLLMAYQAEGKFVFRSVTAVLSFVVSGDYDSYVIASNDRMGIRIGGFRADYTSKVDNYKTFSSDGYPFRKGEVKANGSDINRIIFPGGINFKRGYTIFLGKEGQYKKVYTVESALQIPSGEAVALGDISSSVVDYDGPAPRLPEISNVTKYTVKINEFSGLCLSEDKSFLWAIDDNGKIGKIDITNNVGEVLDSWSSGGDPEGITINPETGDLIVGNEEPVSVGVIKAPVNKSDKQTIIFKIKEAAGYGNSGMEGITYYKKDGDRELIYCGTQVDANLFLCDLNAPVDGSKYTTLVQEPISLRKKFPGVLEIAGLSYDPLTDWLWMIDSEAHKIFIFSGDASSMLGAYPLKSVSNEEGIVVDHSRNCVWVADDYGSPSYLYKYEFADLNEFVIGQ